MKRNMSTIALAFVIVRVEPGTYARSEDTPEHQVLLILYSVLNGDALLRKYQPGTERAVTAVQQLGPRRALGELRPDPVAAARDADGAVDGPDRREHVAGRRRGAEHVDGKPGVAADGHGVLVQTRAAVAAKVADAQPRHPQSRATQPPSREAQVAHPRHLVLRQRRGDKAEDGVGVRGRSWKRARGGRYWPGWQWSCVCCVVARHQVADRHNHLPRSCSVWLESW